MSVLFMDFILFYTFINIFLSLQVPDNGLVRSKCVVLFRNRRIVKKSVVILGSCTFLDAVYFENHKKAEKTPRVEYAEY